jgi:hypothetical protein
MPVHDGAQRLTRVALAEGPCCELGDFERVLGRIAASLDGVPPALRQELVRALLAFAVAHIGGHDAAALPSCDSRA